MNRLRGDHNYRALTSLKTKNGTPDIPIACAFIIPRWTSYLMQKRWGSVKVQSDSKWAWRGDEQTSRFSFDASHSFASCSDENKPTETAWVDRKSLSPMSNVCENCGIQVDVRSRPTLLLFKVSTKELLLQITWV